MDGIEIISNQEEFIMSLEHQSEGEMYKHGASNNVFPIEDVASAQLTDEQGASADRPKKKVIYFADGSTMEDYDDDDDDDKNKRTKRSTDSVEGVISSTQAHSSESAPPVDPSKLQWSEWFRHYSSKAGTKTLTVLEGMGGTAAYYLGITTPKYQSEIDEYNRMAAKKKSHDEELVSWSSGPKASQQDPVVEDLRKIENENIEMTEKKTES